MPFIQFISIVLSGISEFLPLIYFMQKYKIIFAFAGFLLYKFVVFVSVFYKVQKNVTRNGTVKSTTKP